MKVKYKFDKTVNDIKHEVKEVTNTVKHELHFTNNTEHLRENLREDFRYEFNAFKIKFKDFFTEVENNITKLIDECECLGNSTSD